LSAPLAKADVLDVARTGDILRRGVPMTPARAARFGVPAEQAAFATLQNAATSEGTRGKIFIMSRRADGVLQFHGEFTGPELDLAGAITEDDLEGLLQRAAMDKQVLYARDARQLDRLSARFKVPA